jgi:formyl-CoA transferase
LIDRADILIENFKPGVLDRLGFGYDVVSKRRPEIVYCSISGFGQTGPYRSRPGYDVVAQGESGLMDLTGFPDGPPAKVGTSISDIVTGLYAMQGILLALLARVRSHKGQWVDVSLLDSTVATLTLAGAPGNAPSVDRALRMLPGSRWIREYRSDKSETVGQFLHGA